MRLQATIVRQIPFFRRPGLCSRSEVHRRNLLGFVLIILLNGTNFREKMDTNLTWSSSSARHRHPPVCKMFEQQYSQYSLHSNEEMRFVQKPPLRITTQVHDLIYLQCDATYDERWAD
uniref:Uncharacterized protein n=1 Tax=Glossina palpalis gambiensis TaxID=67801 RepID=A0A1B0AS40_9MUSC